MAARGVWPPVARAMARSLEHLQAMVAVPTLNGTTWGFGLSHRRAQPFGLGQQSQIGHLGFGVGVLEGDMMTLLHRVLFYGDHADNIRDLAHLMGLRVIEEGKEMAANV